VYRHVAARRCDVGTTSITCRCAAAPLPAPCPRTTTGETTPATTAAHTADDNPRIQRVIMNLGSETGNAANPSTPQNLSAPPAAV
jgi:hypothetical protein